MTVRSGTAEWHGNVESGSGTVTVGDGVFEGAYSYDSRFGEGKGTNPEQLIAAAHASCFTMALSNVLSAAGHPPESLRTNARVQLRNLDGVPTLARITLDTEGRVTGIDERQFQACADEAKRVCPVSRALAGIPEIVLTAKLGGPPAAGGGIIGDHRGQLDQRHRITGRLGEHLRPGLPTTWCRWPTRSRISPRRTWFRWCTRTVSTPRS